LGRVIWVIENSSAGIIESEQMILKKRNNFLYPEKIISQSTHWKPNRKANSQVRYFPVQFSTFSFSWWMAKTSNMD
jgi:homospermidine synthase